MPRSASHYPTELELLILQVLWENAPLPVREIRGALAIHGRELAHTSVITTLNTMVQKGQLTRKKQGNAFLFSPVIAQDEVSSGMLGDLVERVFDGSASAVMLSLFDCSDVDADELKELRRLLNKKAKEQKQ